MKPTNKLNIEVESGQESGLRTRTRLDQSCPPLHRCWIACLSAAKPIWPPARQSLVISLSAKKMGQEIRPKKRSWPGPVNQTSVGGSALTNVEMRRKSWGKVHQMMICQDGHATFGRISHPSLPDRHSISVLPWHCDEIHLVPHHGSHWSVLR